MTETDYPTETRTGDVYVVGRVRLRVTLASREFIEVDRYVGDDWASNDRYPIAQWQKILEHGKTQGVRRIPAPTQEPTYIIVETAKAAKTEAEIEAKEQRGRQRGSTATQEEINRILRMRERNRSVREISKDIGKSRDFVSGVIARHGTRKRKRLVRTPEVESKIKALSGKHVTMTECARRVGVSVEMVALVRHEFGLKFGDYRPDTTWTDAEVDTLKSMLKDGHTFNQIAKKLGRGSTTVYEKARELGLKSSNSLTDRVKGIRKSIISALRRGKSKRATAKFYKVAYHTVDKIAREIGGVKRKPARGVKLRRGRWVARVYIQRKDCEIGTFDTEREAEMAVKDFQRLAA